MDLRSIGRTVFEHRMSAGLTQLHLAKMADVSRRTIQTLEARAQEDLGFIRISRILSVFELCFTVGTRLEHGLQPAAKSASMDYQYELSEQMLEHTLLTAEVPAGFEDLVRRLLDESPISYVEMAVQETAQSKNQKPSSIWGNVSI